MTLPPTASGQVEAALREVTAKALEAQETPDLISARRALNDVWHAVHAAAETLNRAEREARNAALAKLERTA